jgi:broad specificity phosphatase PhoE
MGYLYVVRHGQANSLGQNYDQLTDLGFTQSRALGEYFLRMRLEFDFVGSGTLKRQKQTLDAALAPLREEGICTSPALEIPEFNEFDSGLWLHIAQRIRLEDPEFAKLYERYKVLQSAGRPSSRQLFVRLIQRVLHDWVSGEQKEPYSFDDYKTKVLSGLSKIPRDCNSALIATSSTPVAVLTGHSLGLEKAEFLPLMRWISNTSWNVFQWEEGKILPITLNSYPHIQDPDLLTLL